MASTPGWLLLPLRLFLGVTFVFAGLQKLADRHFFTASAPTSIQAQIRAFSRQSPLRGLLQGISGGAVIVGLVIAVAELAVGAGALAGLRTRAAAAGGALLSLLFLLTVSWHTRPYYYGADIVFLAAWMPLVIAGDGDVLSIDGLIRKRTRQELRLPPAGPVTIQFATVRQLCGAYNKGRCALRHHRPCDPDLCPVVRAQPSLPPPAAAEFDRRVFLHRGAAIGVAAAAATGVGAIAAIAGRLLSSGGSGTPQPAVASGPPPTTSAPVPTEPATTVSTAPPTRSAPSVPPTTAATAPPPPSGTPIGLASAVPAGRAASFTDPATGDPAFVVHTAAGRFVAFSAVCTHQGCEVQYSRSGLFACPCHGAEFDAATGSVLRGPARTPLPSIPLTEGNDGRLYVDG